MKGQDGCLHAATEAYGGSYRDAGQAIGARLYQGRLPLARRLADLPWFCEAMPVVRAHGAGTVVGKRWHYMGCSVEVGWYCRTGVSGCGWPCRTGVR